MKKTKEYLYNISIKLVLKNVPKINIINVTSCASNSTKIKHVDKKAINIL